jgi:hypothetical protein
MRGKVAVRPKGVRCGVSFQAGCGRALGKGLGEVVRPVVYPVKINVEVAVNDDAGAIRGLADLVKEAAKPQSGLFPTQQGSPLPVNSPQDKGSGILHSVMVATSALVDVRRFTRASFLPPASNLHAFHVSSFIVLSSFEDAPFLSTDSVDVPGGYAPRLAGNAPRTRREHPTSCRRGVTSLAIPTSSVL